MDTISSSLTERQRYATPGMEAHEVVREHRGAIELCADGSTKENDEAMTVSGCLEERPQAKLLAALALDRLVNVLELS